MLLTASFYILWHKETEICWDLQLEKMQVHTCSMSDENRILHVNRLRAGLLGHPCFRLIIFTIIANLLVFQYKSSLILCSHFDLALTYNFLYIQCRFSSFYIFTSYTLASSAFSLQNRVSESQVSQIFVDRLAIFRVYPCKTIIVGS